MKKKANVRDLVELVMNGVFFLMGMTAIAFVALITVYMFVSGLPAIAKIGPVDFLLGRTLSRQGTTIAPEELYDLSDEKDNSVRGGVLALLSKKLLVNSVGALFDLLAKTGSRDAIRTASNYLSTALYVVYRHLYQANPDNNPDFFSVSPQHFHAGLADADMKCSLAELEDALAARVKEKGPMPSMSNNDLVKSCPTLYPSLLQVVHSAGERVAALLPPRQSGKK